jgi:pimeloyl-ACP methyl ester carboxylesterase
VTLEQSTQVALVSTRTADGVLLQGALAGPDDATVGLLAVHGAWGNFYSSPASELLRAGPARGLRVLSLNLRSHDLGSLGDGEPCIGFVRHRMEDGVLDLDGALALLLEVGVERVGVVAHSFGSALAAYWLKQYRPAQVTGLALASPAPPLSSAARWFVDGALDHHLALAARAVAEGDPHRLLVLSSSAPVPMVAEAATVLNVWGPDTSALTHLHVGEIGVPLLVTSALREPSIYRAYAEQVAAAAVDADFEVLDDDHYYSADRSGLAALVLDWFARRALL